MMTSNTEEMRNAQFCADAAFEQLLADLNNYRENSAAEKKAVKAEKAVEDACKAYAKKKAAKRRASGTTGQR